MARLCCTKESTKLTEFKLYAPTAKRVSIVGTFNNWDNKNNLARKDIRGNWTAKISLMPGRYEYKFFVDGAWLNGSDCKACVPNSFGTQNCVVEVR